jgi:hypothetical protein
LPQALGGVQLAVSIEHQFGVFARAANARFKAGSIESQL